MGYVGVGKYNLLVIGLVKRQNAISERIDRRFNWYFVTDFHLSDEGSEVPIINKGIMSYRLRQSLSTLLSVINGRIFH